MSPKKVAVLGGGIIGVSTALRLMQSSRAARHEQFEVTLVSKDVTPDTTGDGSAGFWYPYLLGPNISQIELRSMLKDTFEFLHELYKSPQAGKYGIGVLSGYMLYEEDIPPPLPFADLFFNWRTLSNIEVSSFNDPKFKSGHFFTSLYTECVKLLPHLTEQFVALGGHVIRQEIRSFAELSPDFDLIVNCTGIGAKQLTGDSNLHPIRGQVHRVHAPWIKHALFPGDDTYIIPNSDVVVLGGTHQANDSNLQVSQEDKRRIFEECTKFEPSLAGARQLSDWVGLRPGRDAIRLEVETLDSNGKRTSIVHNYGHGGSGVTLFWGSAGKAVQLVMRELQNSKYKGCAKL